MYVRKKSGISTNMGLKIVGFLFSKHLLITQSKAVRKFKASEPIISQRLFLSHVYPFIRASSPILSDELGSDQDQFEYP